MINWREGLAGFVGASRYLIKNVFEFQYSKTTATPATGRGFGVSGIVDSSGQGVIASIDATGQGVFGNISGTFGVLAIMDNSGQGVIGNMDTSGQGVIGDIL
jgi:hypothetical protein